VALRYFQNKSVREIAAALNIGEDAAKKRLARAVEKLRMYFFKRGINVSTAALSSAVAAHSVQTAPAALAKTITTVALAKGATASTSTLTLIKGASKIMAWTKVKTALVVVVATLLAVSATTVVVKKITSPSVESYFTRMDSKYLNTAPPLVLLRTSRFVGQGAYMVATMDMPNPGKIMRRDCSFAAVLASAYKVDKERIILPEDAPQGQFDLLLTVPDHQAEALREEIKRQF
jgi:Sigma-70, region 4